MTLKDPLAMLLSLSLLVLLLYGLQNTSNWEFREKTQTETD